MMVPRTSCFALALCKKARKCNTFTTGCTDFQRSALTKHLSTSMHTADVQSLKCAEAYKKSIQKAEENCDGDSLICQLRTVHYMARENLPLSKYEGLTRLQQTNGAQMSGAYLHHQQVFFLPSSD